MAECTISLSPYFKAQPADLSTCIGCEEPIYSDVHTLCLQVNGKELETEYKLCTSCREAIRHLFP